MLLVSKLVVWELPSQCYHPKGLTSEVSAYTTLLESSLPKESKNQFKKPETRFPNSTLFLVNIRNMHLFFLFFLIVVNIVRPSFGRQVVLLAQIRIESTGNVLKLLILLSRTILLAQIEITSLLLWRLIDINKLMHSKS